MHFLFSVHHRSHGSIEGVVLAVGEGDTGQLGLGPDVMECTFPRNTNLHPDVIQVVTSVIFLFGFLEQPAIPADNAAEAPSKIFKESRLVKPSRSLFF